MYKGASLCGWSAVHRHYIYNIATEIQIAAMSKQSKVMCIAQQRACVLLHMLACRCLEFGACVLCALWVPAVNGITIAAAAKAKLLAQMCRSYLAS